MIPERSAVSTRDLFESCLDIEKASDRRGPLTVTKTSYRFTSGPESSKNLEIITAIQASFSSLANRTARRAVNLGHLGN